MVKKLVSIGLLMWLASGLLTSGYTQPRIPKEQIPSGIPAEVRTEIEKLYSSNTRERAGALIGLRYMGMEGKAEPAIPFLIQMLGSDDEFPEMILWSLSSLPITRSCSSKYTFGGEAAETLACIGKASDELLGLLKDPDWRVRSNTARALGGLKDIRAVKPLIAFLVDKNEHPEVRGNAALALGGIVAAPPVWEARAVSPLIVVLKDNDSKVRAAAARALGLIGTRPVIEIDPLIVILKDKDPEVRAAAASTLGELHDPRALQPLTAALEDEDAHVRMRAIGALGRIGGPSVLDLFVGALKDTDRRVREVAAGALGRLKDPRAVEPLIAALNDEYVNVQINAAGALGEINDPRAVESLISMLDNKSVQSAAATALGKLKDPRALQPLIAMALKEEPSLPRALQALAELGHAGAREALNSRDYRLDWDEWWNQNKAGLLKNK